MLGVQPLSTTSYALLGLLAIRPWTTYELAKQVRRSLDFFWPRAERKLYDEPKRLVAAGLATATDEHVGRRPRTVYRITAEGRRELQRWLDEPPAPLTLEFEGMVKVFFAENGDREQLQATLERIEHDARARLAVLGELGRATGAGDHPFPERMHVNALSARFAVDFHRLVVSWTTWAQEQVATWDGVATASVWPSWPDVFADASSHAPGTGA